MPKCSFFDVDVIVSDHCIIGFIFTMDGSGDCPQFVSMINSAVHNLLGAKAINNEGNSECFQLCLSHLL